MFLESLILLLLLLVIYFIMKAISNNRSSHRAVGTPFGTIKNTLKRQIFKWKSIQSFFFKPNKVLIDHHAIYKWDDIINFIFKIWYTILNQGFIYIASILKVWFRYKDFPETDLGPHNIYVKKSSVLVVVLNKSLN